LSTYLNANHGHFKISFFQKDKRILENNGLFLAADRVYLGILTRIINRDSHRNLMAEKCPRLAT